MDERTRWARRVAALLREGTPLLAALETARDETDSFELAGPLGFVAQRVRKGWKLADALAELPEVFSPAEVDSIARASEDVQVASALDALGPWTPPSD